MDEVANPCAATEGVTVVEPERTSLLVDKPAWRATRRTNLPSMGLGRGAGKAVRAGRGGLPGLPHKSFSTSQGRASLLLQHELAFRAGTLYSKRPPVRASSLAKPT